MHYPSSCSVAFGLLALLSVKNHIDSLPINQDSDTDAIVSHWLDPLIESTLGRADITTPNKQRTDRLSEIIRLTEQTVQAQRPAFSRVGWLNYTNEYPQPSDYADDADDSVALLELNNDDDNDREISAEQFKCLVQAFETQRKEMDANELSGWHKIELEIPPRTNSKRLILEKDEVSGTKKKSQAQYIP